MLMTVPPVHLVMAGPYAVPVLPDVSLKQLSFPKIMMIIPPTLQKKLIILPQIILLPPWSGGMCLLAPLVWWHDEPGGSPGLVA